MAAAPKPARMENPATSSVGDVAPTYGRSERGAAAPQCPGRRTKIPNNQKTKRPTKRRDSGPSNQCVGERLYRAFQGAKVIAAFQ